MEMNAPRHESGKPANKNEPKKVVLGQHLTLLDKTLSYYVSQRGMNCFWARVLNQCSIQVDPTLGTAGVLMEEGGKRHAFIYDPGYFQNLSPASRRCTLVHEAVHVTCLHIIRFMRLMKSAPNDKVRKAIRAVFNIAADMETNDAYVRLEKDFQKTVDEGEFWHLPEQHLLPPGQSMETYIELLLTRLPSVVAKLKQMAEEREAGEAPPCNQGGPSGRSGYHHPQKDDRTDDEKAADTAKSVGEASEKFEGLVDQLLGIHPRLTNDTHDRWMAAIEDMARNDPTKLEQLIEQMQRNTAKDVKHAYDTTTKLRGTVPGSMQQKLTAMLQEPTVPWTEMLRDWVLGNMGKQFTATTRLPSYSLMHLDEIEPFPGQVFEPEVNVAWITDTSGSMSDECFQKAASEMQHLMHQTKAIRCHHLQVDTVIQNETLHDNNDDQITAQIRYGYGGTVLKAAFARAVNIDLGLWRHGVEKIDEVRAPDMMVVYTDGYIEDMAPVLAEYHPGVPTLWLISPGGTIPPAVARAGAPHFVVQIPR